MHHHIPFRLIFSLRHSLYKLYLMLKNLLFLPKLAIDIKQKDVVFVAQDGKKHHYPYFCLIITNNSNKELHINPSKIKVNNENYNCIVQSDENFLHLNPASKKHWNNCENEVYNMYSVNWLSISTNDFLFVLKPYQSKIFPMRLIEARAFIITSVKTDSLLFHSKEKVGISLEINKKSYEYGINRKYVYERYINYLAFYMQNAIKKNQDNDVTNLQPS